MLKSEFQALSLQDKFSYLFDHIKPAVEVVNTMSTPHVISDGIVRIDTAPPSQIDGEFDLMGAHKILDQFKAPANPIPPAGSVVLVSMVPVQNELYTRISAGKLNDKGWLYCFVDKDAVGGPGELFAWPFWSPPAPPTVSFLEPGVDIHSPTIGALGPLPIVR